MFTKFFQEQRRECPIILTKILSRRQAHREPKLNTQTPGEGLSDLKITTQ